MNYYIQFVEKRMRGYLKTTLTRRGRKVPNPMLAALGSKKKFKTISLFSYLIVANSWMFSKSLGR